MSYVIDLFYFRYIIYSSRWGHGGIGVINSHYMMKGLKITKEIWIRSSQKTKSPNILLACPNHVQPRKVCWYVA